MKKQQKKNLNVFFGLSIFILILVSFKPDGPQKIVVTKDMHISLIGGNMGSRMLNYGTFDTEMHLHFPDKNLVIRNLCDGGDTPGFRPHPSRNTPWAFPGAEKFNTDVAQPSDSEGHYPYPDEWLTTLKTDVIIAFFGFSESFKGPKGLPTFKAELTAFIKHTKAQKYNGINTPQLALVSPTAFENLSFDFDLPNGEKENRNLDLYTKAIKEVAQKHNVLFLDAFNASKTWKKVTIDGIQLNQTGYQKLASILVDRLFKKSDANIDEVKKIALTKAVLEKDYFWHNDYKMPNGVHVYGRRYKPFGLDNYPDEILKTRQMTVNRDSLVWAIAKGKTFDLVLADARTKPLKPIETNFELGKSMSYLYGQDALDKFTMAEGFKIELFASEKEFPDLANPSQISFDNQGRLWVAVMPTYPHYKPGDARPNDKLIILEDTDGDFKADKQTTFIDKLHIPAGFEFAPEGVYVSQGTNLKLFTDTNGDDRADKEEIVLSGFDDHDTHHVISAFCADPSGAIIMGEGIFLHSNVETPYGTVRATNGGFMRYVPQQKKLERIAQLPIPNPWGTAFDVYGQGFFESTSNPSVYWLTPGTIKSTYGISSPTGKDLIEEKHRVRPTSGLEFVSSRHFPDEFQGDMMLNNTIGFLGTKMHQVLPDGSGYTAKHRLDLLRSTDPNFRPVDLEFAPDGSLYIADWHNIIVGHMQHNARDPLRDHVHGRIYRVTYPSRPLLQPAKVHNASIEELFENLKLPEYRTKYRTRRALRAFDKNQVFSKMQIWIKELDSTDSKYENHLLEALWVSWGINRLDESLLNRLYASKDEKIRAATVQVARYMEHQMPTQKAFIQIAAQDKSGHVRMEALVASTWQSKVQKNSTLARIAKQPMDAALKEVYNFVSKPTNDIKDSNLQNKANTVTPNFAKGKEIYNKEGYCATCHQSIGSGLVDAGFPPLSKSNWVTGNPDRLIKLVLHGMSGPITVNGKNYPGSVPMTPYGGMLNDADMAAVLNYIRNDFDNKSTEIITKEKVKAVREETKARKSFYTAAELLKQHPD